MSNQYFDFFMMTVKMFLMHVFLYMLFLEAFVVGYLIENNFGIELPFFEAFIGGIFTFIFITVWYNVSIVFQKKVRSLERLIYVALSSEAPFAILIIILWMALFVKASHTRIPTDITVLMKLFTLHMFLFPLVVGLAKSHTKKLKFLGH